MFLSSASEIIIIIVKTAGIIKQAHILKLVINGKIFFLFGRRAFLPRLFGGGFGHVKLIEIRIPVIIFRWLFPIIGYIFGIIVIIVFFFRLSC